MPATRTSAETEQPVGVPWRSPALLAVLAATLLTPMDVPLLSPVLPEIQAVFGVSESRAGLFVTLYAVPGIVLAPVIGALADRIGRRYVLAGCLVVFGLAGTAVAFTGEFAVAVGLRVVQGFAAGSVLSALAMTVVGDRYTGRQHDSVMGVTSAMLSIGTAAYPLIGGYLATYGWQTPFYIYAFAIPVAGLVLFALDDRPVPTHRSADSGYLGEALRAVPTRRALGLYGVMFVSFGLLFGGIYTAVPFYLADAFGFGSTTVGLFTSGMLLVTAFVAIQNDRVTARLSTGRHLAVGFVLYSVGMLVAGLASAPPVLVAGLLAFGVGSGLVTPTLFAALSALAPPHVRGGVMSLQTTTIGLSQAVAPLVFTRLGGAIGYRSTLVGASIGAALGAVALAFVAR